MKTTLPNILGKEFDCINKIIKKLPVKGIGDDCAVLSFGGSKLLISVDTFTDKVHFDTKYFSLEQIGNHCSEATISDIAAMGAKPLYVTLSLAVPNHKLIGPLSAGIRTSLLKHGVTLVGGDTTFSKILSISMTVIGSCNKPIYRNGAKKGDAVYITGMTGLSAAGLYAIKNKTKGREYIKNKHLLPKARIKEGILCAKHANAMIDISDGLVSELHHIAFQSNVSIEIEHLPIDKELKSFCKEHGLSPEAFALYGGEDYELIVVGPGIKLSKIKGLIKIGKVVPYNKKKQVSILRGCYKDVLNPLKGFKHF